MGCYVANLFIAAILFADDAALAAPTRGALQKLVDLSVAFCKEHCLSFNPKKTGVIVFGKDHGNIASFSNLNIDNIDIDYVESARYLGFFLKASKSCCRYSHKFDR